MMGDLPQYVIAKVSGLAWEPLRGQFMEIGRLLMDVSADTNCELFGSYARFTASIAPKGQPYAAVWLKTNRRLIVGLALPEAYEAEELGPAPPGTVYKGLTKYLTVERGGVVSEGFADWVRMAYQNVQSADGKQSPSIPSSAAA
jgi:hypothetical protein